ncbi:MULTISPECIES: tRNA (adenosine(37)-N6)-dimethylallyltransferase MiaA [unclassified Campylobacter]|uniref:tRNA (adenosine(37)-N6)-dimethylallyltransferase MiaA n=1 Tax=unclassified Campylobacter TaxID=2593542 RepID=UPI0022E9B3AC|nr:MULTISPECIES: tRNA (adenosine(37)-N6)-dimethylallyltransferase MiaA [unclassified Campylobacter]MDA3055332.1 tRNA (adenosine(37)-N6)-dimethylallyltransferase MiaA [Campylobacter sp. CN_NA1]MDA3066048.1 tRNA (adenosine(37)-N6)-dimethylallyltransferase MiaA [Campylobacter sp. CN_NE4]MDA3068534.1 tRNA (adenosine(37)-N6)-dimethylallyltransferase MiaA [Campylobacter sp. CN_NE3]MDA3082489.1 tRNA (adenosine(37)-N6)-dimethylallyltransferase MiaA [Campylobacter sp. CN_EL2]MDA3084119.1 tRNA (adenosin
MFCEFALIGTTASGKSDLALKIAKEFNGVILSLDSLSVYKEINIASAKPTALELESVKHFGINLIFPNEYFSVGEFIKEYEKAKSYAQNLQIPLIITGGSGFYLKAMMSGLAPKIRDIKCDLNLEQIYELILKIDPEFGSKFSKNDKFRLEKWYSIYKTTGEIPSKFLRENTAEPIISNLQIFEILWDKEVLRDRIKIRTEKMLENGLIAEAKYLFGKYGFETKSLNSIGLKECGEFLRGELGKNELYEQICTHTAQLAKRQRTFNKSQFLENKISQDLTNLENSIRNFLQNL